MALLSPPRKAAQYLRISTEHQQYSTANQQSAIATYAANNNIEIVTTYEDSGKSGLTLAGRPALRRLLADVAGGGSPFDIILVYDVSRWGRFQDADESAHLEYLCRLGGAQLIYCAEMFPNDGTPFASICKVVKRALAAEYSRELSEKVFRGKQRLIKLGFRQGGSAGIGLRRCLIDAKGAPKAILTPGERKNLATDRVILVPGPPQEVALVKRIYRDYEDRGMGCIAIADALNRRGTPSESGRPWSRAVVKRILTSAKHTGDNVWGRTSFKLKVTRRQNPIETWIQTPAAFEGIIGRGLFEKAQHVRRQRCVHLSDNQIVARLRYLYLKHGRITARLVRSDGFVGVKCIRKRFGSLVTAAERAGYSPKRNQAYLKNNQCAQNLRSSAAEELLIGFSRRGHSIVRQSGSCRFQVHGEICFTVAVSQQRRSQSGVQRWLVKPAEGKCDLRLALLMNAMPPPRKTYFIFPVCDLPKECLIYNHNAADLEALRASTLEPLYDLCAREMLDIGYHVSEDLYDLDDVRHWSSHGLPPRKPRNVRLRPRECKTYAGAFKRASSILGEAIARSKSVGLRLTLLRALFAELLMQGQFRVLLKDAGITSVPCALRSPERHAVEARERLFRQHLRGTATKRLSDGRLSRRVNKLLVHAGKRKPLN